MELHTIELLDELENMIENGKKSLIGGRISVEKNDVLSLIDQLRDLLPREMMHANDFYKDSREVLDSAQNQADAIVADAEKEADDAIAKAHQEAQSIIDDANTEADAIVQEALQKQSQLVAAHEITRLANQEGEAIVSKAEQRATEIKIATKKYLENKLGSVADVLAKTYAEINENKKGL
jgi:vacuolar-type H+-ATPase subunit H